MAIKLSIFGIVLVNLIPFIGISFYHIPLLDILLFFWMESFAVGFFNVWKMSLCKENNIKPSAVKYKINNKMVTGKWPLIQFFIFHYGMFMAFHLIFLILFFNQGKFGIVWNNLLDYSIALWGLIFFASHGLSFVFNYVHKKEYQTEDMNTLMIAPYKRIVLMHFVIIFGGFFIMKFNLPIAAFALFILLKTVIDILSHLAEHKQEKIKN